MKIFSVMGSLIWDAVYSFYVVARQLNVVSLFKDAGYAFYAVWMTAIGKEDVLVKQYREARGRQQ